MKLLLVVQREDDAEDSSAWITAVADEYTIDEHNGAPEWIDEALAVDPANTRLLWVEIPDGSLSKTFAVPTVRGTVE